MHGAFTAIVFISSAAALGATVAYLMYGQSGNRNSIIIFSAALFGAAALIANIL